MKTALQIIGSIIFMLNSITGSSQNHKAIFHKDQFNSAGLQKQHSNLSPVIQRHETSNKIASVLSGYYVESFEGTFPPTGWQVIDVQDLTRTWVHSVGSAYEGLGSAYLNYTSASTIQGEDWLVMPKFTVGVNDSLSFWLKPQTVGFPPDSTYLLISTTDTALSSFTNVLAILAEGYNYPSTTTFQNYKFDLSGYTGQDIYVAFVNKNKNGDGIYIDKVTLGTAPSIDASSFTIDMPLILESGITTSPLATVINSGLTTQTFDVTMSITGGYTSTKTVSNLGAGLSQQVIFDPWTPVLGAYTISTQTLLINDGYAPNDSISKSLNVLEPFTNYGWKSMTNLNTGYFDAGIATLNGNDTSYLFQAGGYATTAPSADANLFATSSNTWTSIGPVNTAEFTASAAGVNNKVYLFGGYDVNFNPIDVTQVYDMSAGTWSFATPMPIATIDYALCIYNNYIYCIGGFDGTNEMNAVQIYNTTTDTWTMGTPIPMAIDGLRGGNVDNKIIICGGYNGSTIANSYLGTIDLSNPANITWTQVADYPAGALSRHGGAGSLITTSGLVVFTGGDPQGDGVVTRSETVAYDLNSNTWKIGPAKPTPVNNLCNLAAIVDNDSLYIAAVGGNDANGNPSTANEWLNLGPYQIPSGINENSAVYSLEVSPNPVHDVATIVMSSNKNKEKTLIKIIDGSGKCIRLINAESYSLSCKFDTSKFSKGTYLLELFTGNKLIKTGKLIVE